MPRDPAEWHRGQDWQAEVATLLKQLTLAALAAIVTALAVGLCCALALSVVDIYLAGHGKATLGRSWIDGSLIHMSRADGILLLASLISAVLVGWAVWRALRSGGYPQRWKD